MEIAFWILLCMLAYVSIIEIYGRLCYGVKPLSAAARGCIVVWLEHELAPMRAQMEYYISWLEWNGSAQKVLLVHKNSKAAKDMFEQYLGGFAGIELCELAELSERINPRR